MKIALVVHDYNPRVGQGCYAVELAERFKIRHEVHVIANTFGGISPDGLTFHPVRVWRRNTLLKVLSFLWASERVCRGQTFDIIDSQGLSNWNCDVITAHICNAARRKLAPPGDFKNRLFQNLVQ